MILKGATADLCDSVWFFEVTSELGEDLVIRYTNANGKTQLLTARLAYLLSDFHATPVQLAAGYIQPAFVHSKGLHEIGVSLVDCLGHLGVFQILIVVGRDNDQVLT